MLQPLPCYLGQFAQKSMTRSELDCSQTESKKWILRGAEGTWEQIRAKDKFNAELFKVKIFLGQC
jgi:hypothetical protein